MGCAKASEEHSDAEKSGKSLAFQKKTLPLQPNFEAQMAESVDALVSNTSGATRAGSTPALGTRLKSR